MPPRWLPVTASVSWRAERRGYERPVALVIAGERFPVEEEHSWVEGPAVAGRLSVRVFVVRDARGRRFRVRCREDLTTSVERDLRRRPREEAGSSSC